MPYVLHLASEGVHAATATNPGLKLGVNVAAGAITYAPVAEAVGLAHVAVDEALASVPAGAR
jgi:alanine dehydrogenase